MSRNYDNWERLVAAVIKKEQIWQLCHQNSISTISSDFSSHLDLSYFPVSLGSLDTTATFKFIRSLGLGNHGWNTDLVELEQDVQVWNQQYFGKGTKVVIKSLNNSKTTEHELEQYMAVLGSCRHENVATPWAYHFSQEKMLILDNYHSQGSVFDMLRGEGRMRLNWKSRIRIAIGAARGVAYIHKQSGRAHGNIKSSNVFVNKERYGCVSDFGWVEKGAPASQKSDVYSFGVVLFEIFTRPSPMQEVDIDDHIRGFKPYGWDLRRYQGGRLVVDEVDMRDQKTSLYVDGEVLYSVQVEELRRTLDVAKRCLAPAPRDRPSMAQVVSELEKMEPLIPLIKACVNIPHIFGHQEACVVGTDFLEQISSIREMTKSKFMLFLALYKESAWLR